MLGRIRVAVLLVACAMPAAAWAGPPALDFRKGSDTQRQAGECALTFDDGPGPHTGVLLDALAAKRVKATFFVLGENVRRYPELIRRMVAEGHEVENHSWDHPDMVKLDQGQRQKEIEDTIAQLKELGVTPHFFRPPYGAYDKALVQQARDDGLLVVLWSHDSVDWRYHTVAQIEGNALPAGQGAHGVFLFHDIHDSTIAAMPPVIDELASKGCHFVTVAQWAADTGSAQDPVPTGPAATATMPVAKPIAAERRGSIGHWLENWVK